MKTTREESLIQAVATRFEALGSRPAFPIFAKTADERNRRMALIQAWTAGKTHIGADALRTMRSFNTPIAAAMVERWEALVAAELADGVPEEKAAAAVVDDCHRRVKVIEQIGSLGPEC